MTFDPETFGREMSTIVRDTVRREVAPLRDELTAMQKRLDAAEAREPVPGPRGEPGVQGRGIASAVVRTDGLLILSLTDGETIEAGTVNGRDGKDGAPGVDGRDGADGVDGRNVDPEEVRQMVNEAVAALPPAERGEPGLQGAPGQDGADGRDGLDGKDGASVTVEDVAPVITAEVERAVSALPPPEPGRDGQDGKDGADGADGRSITPDEVREMLGPLVADAVAAIPAPEPGPQGDPGEPGLDGKDGTSVTVDDLAPLVSEEVQRAVSAIPAPKDGADGRDGKDGTGIGDLLIDAEGELVATFTDGRTKRLGRIVGTDGRDGTDGARGKGFTGGQIDAEGHLHLTLDDGSNLDLGRVMGADGKDGAPGADGRDGKDGETLSLDDFDMSLMEDGRTVVFSFTKGEMKHSFEIGFPVVLDRGAWKEAAYERGDSVSWAGSTWIAQRDTAADEKPGSSDAWRLSVKRGRDGKPGRDGKDGQDG